MKKENKIMVERETFEKNGKSYYSYFIKGNIRGKDVRVLITPPVGTAFAHSVPLFLSKRCSCYNYSHNQVRTQTIFSLLNPEKK